MADVSGLGVTDWGSLLNSFGQGQQQQRLTGSEADRQQQAAVALQQQNQITQASMPLVMRAIQSMQQEQQNNVDPSQSDVSDGDQSSTTSGGTTPGGMPVGAASTDVMGSATSAADSDASATSPINSQSVMDPGRIGRVDQGLRQSLTVNPAGTPQEQQAISTYAKQAATLSGLPGIAGSVLGGQATGKLEQAKIQRELNIQQRYANAQLQSGNIFDKMRAVLDSGDGNALHTLDGVDHATAARIRSYESDPVNQEADARAYAMHVAGEVHQYTGRKAIKHDDGYFYDEVSGIRIPVDRVGMSLDQEVGLYKDVLSPTTVPDGKGGSVQMAKWRVPTALGGYGAVSPAAAFMRAAAAGGAAGANPQVAASATAADMRDGINKAHAQDQRNAPPGSAQSNAHGVASQSNRSNFPVAPNTWPSDINAPRPVDKDGIPTAPLPTPIPGARDEDVWPIAVADRFYHQHNTPGVPGGDPDNRGGGLGTTPTTIQQGNMDNWKSNNAAMQEWSKQATLGSSQAITNFTEARRIMAGQYDGKNFSAIQGLPGEIAAQIAQKTGTNSITAVNRAEAAKYLVNAALSQYAGQYNTAPPSVEALRVNTSQAFPSTEIPTQAALKLIDGNLAQAAYVRNAAARYAGAAQLGVSPANYLPMYEHYLPRSNALQATTNPPTVRVLDPNGKSGSIPASRQKEYLAHGFKLAPAAQ